MLELSGQRVNLVRCSLEESKDGEWTLEWIQVWVLIEEGRSEFPGREEYKFWIGDGSRNGKSCDRQKL